MAIITIQELYSKRLEIIQDIQIFKLFKSTAAYRCKLFKYGCTVYAVPTATRDTLSVSNKQKMSVWISKAQQEVGLTPNLASLLERPNTTFQELLEQYCANTTSNHF